MNFLASKLIYEIDENIVERLSSKRNKQGLSENSQATYRTVIRDFNRFLAINDYRLTPESLKAYFDELKQEKSYSTLNLRKYALLKIIKVLFGEGNPLKELAIEKVFESIDTYSIDKAVPSDEVLSELDVLEIIEAARTNKTKLLIRFLFKTGCRVSEMINIRLRDCEFVNGHVKIKLNGKGKKERKVYIERELFDEITSEYSGCVWLFESSSGKQLNRSNILIQIQKAAMYAGIDDWKSITPHKFRHARATDLLLEKNMSLKAVSKYLGHASTSITADMYLHDEVVPKELFSRDSI